MNLNDDLTQELAKIANSIMNTEATKLDKVNPKAVKKKFDDRKDKDIDNDGDVDSSDEYLHKRRKAISKATKEEVELEEATELFKKGKITLTKFAMGKGKGAGLQINYGTKFIQVPEKDIKQLYTAMVYVTKSVPQFKEEVELEEASFDKLAKKLGRINPETLGDVLKGKIKLSPAERKEFDAFMKGARKMFASESTDLEEATMSQGVKTAQTQIYSLEKSLKAGSNLNKGVNKSLEGKYDADFKKMEKAIGQIISVWEEIERDFSVNESTDFEKTNTLTSDEYDEVQNFQNFNKKDWRWLPKQGKYVRKKKV